MSWKVQTLYEVLGLLFNIEILCILIVNRILWKMNSRKSGRGVHNTAFLKEGKLIAQNDILTLLLSNICLVGYCL